MVAIIVLLALAVIPAAIASSKGRNFFIWYLYGLCLFIIALIHSIILAPDEAMSTRTSFTGSVQKKCPYCAEFVKAEARVCRFCGKSLVEKFENQNSRYCKFCNAPIKNLAVYCKNCGKKQPEE